MRFVCVFEAVYVCVCAGQSKTGSIVKASETLLIYAPPHPTHVCTHIPANTEKTVLTPQVHMNVNTCPTPPHPTHARTYRQTQRRLYLPRKFTWTLIHAPPHPTPPMYARTYRQTQRRLYLPRKFTWTLIHAPPHPTHVCTHIPANTGKTVLTPQAHMNFNTCPTPPHPPMCTKHHGLLKAVLQLYIYIKIYKCVPGSYICPPMEAA